MLNDPALILFMLYQIAKDVAFWSTFLFVGVFLFFDFRTLLRQRKWEKSGAKGRLPKPFFTVTLMWSLVNFVWCACYGCMFVLRQEAHKETLAFLHFALGFMFLWIFVCARNQRVDLEAVYDERDRLEAITGGK